jgi:hypothetical protein
MQSIVQSIMIYSLTLICRNLYDIFYGAVTTVFPGSPWTFHVAGHKGIFHDDVVKARSIAPGW